MTRPYYLKGTWVSTQHLKLQLCYTQRRAARLVVGDGLCISTLNTLPSQPSSGQDQMCNSSRWAVVCTDPTKAGKALQHGFAQEKSTELVSV